MDRNHNNGGIAQNLVEGLIKYAIKDSAIKIFLHDIDLNKPEEIIIVS